MKSRKWRIGAILLAAVVFAGAVAGIALADPGQSQNAVFNDLYQSFVSKLAANLGLEQDKVTAALEATKKQMLDEAVQQGKITQEQADKIASGKGFGLGMFGPRHGKGDFTGKGFYGRGPNLEDAASILGMTVDQLKTELQSKKMSQIITEKGMTMDQFHQKMMELKKEAISSAVEEGKLTQEQADKIIEKMGQRFKNPQPAAE
ncbi:MAG: DUF2680 domain-containing protein [Pelotomaculum sp.]|uniref:DUF2680 domain-containing protein n=1 Tax=Pelotomaculum thermopropionicum (strain DSM 13744 / JCM 10971 / SI) TaxID=370438 RepID=A5D0W4_PELTS|nr:DUF2680 domain-containing protein [Pelotomaculum sp.]BAF60118.1 hypothetical protein PTH_1937 [Pelotomaculum thermopropionicum SI]